jgi:aspartate/methionine/tyrosine aminotransferase
MTRFIAKRLDDFDSSKIRAAFEFAEDIPNPIDLSIGFPEDDTPEYIKLAGIEAIRDNHTRYTSTNGMRTLRESIAKKLGSENSVASSPSQVTITPGITTGILLCYLATLDPDDEVLLPDPYFPPYKDLAVMLGAKAVVIDTAPSFQLTAELIKPHITAKTKVLVVNTPNNPSGAVYPEGELRKIAELANKHNLLVISDEVYEYFCYDGRHFSIGSIYPNTLTLNGFSKGYAMTGWRIGYINGPREVIEAVNELLQYTVFSSSSVGQHAALAALRHRPLDIGVRYRAKRDKVRALLEPTFSDLQGGQGAFFFFAKLPGRLRDMKFVNQLSHRGVIVLPGSAFSSHQNYIRVSYAGESERLEKGLNLLCESVGIMQRHHSID